jgi:hypothetical protein
MKIFLGYQNNRQAINNLERFHLPVAQAMRPQHDVFCALEATAEYAARGLETYDQRLKYCLEQIPGSGLFIAVIKIQGYEGGIVKELEEAALQSVPIVAAVQQGIAFPVFLDQIAAAKFTFRNQQELMAEVSQY